MEMNEDHFLEELMALRREISCDLSIPTEMSDLNFDYSFNQNSANFFSNPSFLESSFPFQIDEHNLSYLLNEELVHYPLSIDQFSVAAPQSNGDSISTFGTVESTPSNMEVYNGDHCPITSMEEEELGILEDEIHGLEVQASCKLEPAQSPDIPVFNFGHKNSCKKLQGQPSKNLMAERRRRKRLNERLSMLRSIVPKISKMDRTAILADAIDYVKELLEKIKNLQREIEVENPNQLETKPNEYLVRNSPKFDVERRNSNTRIEICCAAKPGLLLSTVNTIEALGLDIQQCVISCFNDFAIQASCSEEMEHRTALRTDEVKQALFENAGYAGRCLQNNIVESTMNSEK